MDTLKSVLATRTLQSSTFTKIYFEHYDTTAKTFDEILSMFLVAVDNPSVQKFEIFYESVRALIFSGNRLEAIMWTCIPTLVLSIGIFSLLVYIFSSSAKNRKSEAVHEVQTVLPPARSPSESDKQFQRESSRAKLQSFASNLAKEIAATDKANPATLSTLTPAAVSERKVSPSSLVPSPSVTQKQERLPSVDTSVTRDSADFDTWSVQSGITSEYLEADRNEEDSSVSSISTSAVLNRSLVDPGALSGLRIAVAGYGVGIVLGYERKKFRSTRFRVLFDDGKVKLLKLKRSAKKGVVPFTLLEQQQTASVERAWAANSEALHHRSDSQGSSAASRATKLIA